MSTVTEAIRTATQRLAATSDTARLDAELLMAHALGCTRSELLLRHTRDPAPPAFAVLVERRAKHEPVAYITGHAEFYGLEFEVSPHVLIPRSDSETLITAAREVFADKKPKRILDLGTGSGALLLTAMTIWPEAEGLGVDQDAVALVTALKNAERVGVNARPTQAELKAAFASSGVELDGGAFGYMGRARFNCADWRKRGWRKHLGTFDLILCNPPYVEDDAPLEASVREYEPAGALFAGPEGLDDYRVLLPRLSALLNPGGVAVFEIGHTQADAVTALAQESDFSAELHRDLAGRPRALVLRHVSQG